MNGDDESWIDGRWEREVQLVMVKQEVVGCDESWCARSRMSETIR